MLVTNTCGKLLVFHYSGDGREQRKFYQSQVVAELGLMRLFLNSMPLLDKIYWQHICTGKYSLINVATIVSADLSGMGNASGHLVK